MDNQTNSTIIPEMQKIKEKYPQYKDTPDYDLLQAISKRFPVYQKSLEEVNQRRATVDQSDLQNKQQNNSIIRAANELTPDALAGIGNIPLGYALRHGWGAVQAAVSGKNPIEGFKDPENQQSFGVSIAKAYNLDLNNPVHFATAAVGDALATIATGHLLYGAPVKAVTEGYNAVKNSALDRLHDTIHSELQSAGVSHSEAGNIAKATVNKIAKDRFLNSNPIAVNSMNQFLKGKLGTAIKDHIEEAKSSAKEQGFSEDFFKKQLTPKLNSMTPQQSIAYKTMITPAPITPKSIGVSSKFEPTRVLPPNGTVINQPPEGAMRDSIPSTDYGRQIQEQLQKKYEIPLHPASEGKIAVATLLRNQPATAEKQPNTTGTTEGGGLTPLKNQESSLPSYKDTPEINKVYIEHESKAPFKVVPIKSVKLSKSLTDSAASIGAKNVKNIPIMVNSKMEVVDGNHRLTDAIANGEKTIKVTVQPTELYSTKDVSKKVFEPNTGANPGNRYSAQVRHRGWAVAEKFFNTKEEANAWLDNLPLDISKIEMTKGVVKDYANAIKGAQGFGVIDITPPIIKQQISAVKPEEIKQSPDIADEVLQRQGNQKPESIVLAKGIRTIPTPEIPKITETPSARKTLKDMRLQSIKDASEKYHPNTFWDVTFIDGYGVHNTMIDGPGLKLLENNVKVVNKSKLLSNKGELNLEPFFDIVTNAQGEVEKATNEYKYLAKMFGNSFFIGEKYPPFKKVLDAMQNPVDSSNEMFYNGIEMLDRKSGEQMNDALQERVNQALNYGDSQSVQKYFSNDELKEKFGMTDKESAVYQNFVKMYKHGLSIALQTRKLEIGFQKLDPQQQQLAEADLKNQMDKIGGYISHTRLGGDWAVYQPGDKEGDSPKFFDLFKNKSESDKMSAKLQGSKVYLKTNIPREDYGKLSIHDLQSLAEAQDLNPQSPDYLAMKEELMKRNSNKNWIRRNWVPRSEQTLKDKYDNAIDYLNGQTSRYARVKGRIDGQQAFNDNAKLMNPSLAKYAKQLMDIYYSGNSQDSNKVFQGLNKVVYAYRLMFKTSFFLQHLTHPLSVTYPELAKDINGLDTEKIFFNAYNMSRRYALHKINGSVHGLSKDTMDMMDKLHKQGYLGDQLNKFQLDSRTRIRTGFERFIGSMARVSEGTNRVHSAMAGMLKANHLNITDPSMREDFVKNFMKKTVFLYGRLYTPTLITGSGVMKSAMNTMYRFRSFEVNYLHALASNFRYGPASYLRSIGGMTAMAGIKGAPFFALLAMAYAWKTGHTLDNDMREAAQEAHIPDKAIDMSLHGVPALAGADLSGLIGTSDIISPYGNDLSKIGGASVGFVQQIYDGINYMAQGDRQRAIEKLVPDFAARILRAQRYSREGIRKLNGDTILANPSKFDTVLSSTGIQPLDFTKAYDARDAKDTLLKSETKRNSQYNELLAKNYNSPVKYEEILQKIDTYNKTAKDEDKILISQEGINHHLQQMEEGKHYPKRMKMVIDHINQRYGIKE